MARSARVSCFVFVTWLAATLSAFTVQSQPPSSPPSSQASGAKPDAPTRKPDEGIPITDATVVRACGGCHKSDEKQQLSRISFQRNTPEGWQETIRRMVALNGLTIEPAAARDVV